MHRIVSVAFFAALVGIVPAAPASDRSPEGLPSDTTFQIEELRFVAPDGVELAGSLYVPSGKGPFPGAVIIQGSGSSDRTNLWARTFAETLARAGVATLLPDKRGSGESGGSWLTADFETLARDALAGVDRVAARASIDARSVGLVGLSQGGYVAPLAAASSADVAWVVDISGAAVPIDAQMRHELANTARKAGLDADGVEAIVEIQRRAERYVETGEWDPYVAALEEAEGTPWAPVAEGFPQDPDAEIWSWVRLNGSFDPLPRWKELDVPILVVYGEEDEADNVPVDESVDRLGGALREVGHEDHTIHVVPEAGHALWAPDATQEDLRLHPDLVELLTGWIHDRSGGKTDDDRCAALGGGTYRGTARSAVPPSTSTSSPSGRR